MLYYFYMIYCKNFFEPNGCTSYYIGSHNEFEDREKKHQISCNNPNDKYFHLKVYKNIRANGGWEKWNFIHLGSKECETERQAHMIEQDYMDLYEPDLNMKRAYTSPELRKENNKNYARTEKAKARKKKWNEDNKERLAELVKNWAIKNKEKRQKQSKEYNEANKEKIAEKSKRHYEANKDKILAKTACPCGGSYTSSGKKPHLETIKHKTWLSCQPCSS